MEDEDDPGVLLNAWLGELDSLQKVRGLTCRRPCKTIWGRWERAEEGACDTSPHAAPSTRCNLQVFRDRYLAREPPPPAIDVHTHVYTTFMFYLNTQHQSLS